MISHSRIGIAFTAAVALGLSAFAAGCGPSTTAASTPAPQSPTTPTASTGDQSTNDNSKTTTKVPDFTLETIDGDSVSLSDYVGKNVILIDFWATWCEPCLAAMPHLNEIYGKHKDQGFVLLSVSMDGPDTVAEVRSYASRHNLQFPVLLDQESRAVSLYNPRRSAPYSILIGRDGSIISKHDGYQPGDEVALEKEIVQALEAK